MAGLQQALLAAFGATAHTYATLNASTAGTNVALSNGNLTATFSGAGAGSVISNIGKSSGKWYFECTVTTGGTGQTIGVATASQPAADWIGQTTAGYGYRSNNGDVLTNGANIYTGGGTYTTANVIGIALDAGGQTISFYKNNVAQYTTQSISGLGASATIYAGVGQIGATASAVTFNFGATALTYTPPSGYNAGLYN